jgi:hypothetical protein
LSQAYRTVRELTGKIKAAQRALLIDPSNPGAEIQRRVLPRMIDKRDAAQATVMRLAPLEQSQPRSWRQADNVTWSPRTTPITAAELDSLEIPSFLRRHP